MEQKKKAAQQGFNLLKKKSDALTAKFRGMLKEIVKTKLDLGEELRDAAFTLAKGTWAAGDFQSRIVQAVKRPAVTLKVKTENVAGVRLPNFTIHTDGTVNVLGTMGMAGGGQVLVEVKERYQRVLSALVRLASLQTSFFTLDEEIKMTNRRVNALDNVVIPRFDYNIQYINKELHEMEREEFFRLKKIQEKKKARMAIEEALLVSMQKNISADETVFRNKDTDIIF
eukprot:Trichotokara_eunicae@DN5102_c0_g1_i2.p1